MLSEFHEWFSNKSISTKITGTCTAFFIMLIALVNVVMWLGISYALYHPAEATIRYSMAAANKLLEMSTGDEPDKRVFRNIRKSLASSVVLRIFDEDGDLIYDTNGQVYPSNDTVEASLMEDPPLFATDDFDIAQIGDAIVYRAKMNIQRSGQNLTMYFFRTITSQNDIFDDLKTFMLITDLFCLIFAVMLSRFVSQKVLKPIKTITALAKKITLESERERVKERIPLPPANDEMTELAKTFNTMLDRMQGDISKHKDFVSNASHELKKPLTVIEGYAEILKKLGDKNQALRNESAEIILDEAQNMTTLLENLRALTRNDENTLNLHKENFNLAEIVETAIQRANKAEGNSHEVKLIRNDAAQIYGDKSAILQMLRVFLDNAIKYTPSGGSVTLTSIKQGDKVLLSIADTGIGIAAEDLGRIFERGVRLTENPYVEQAKGSGIGLFMAKLIADEHGIAIGVESKLGEGTTFTLTIACLDDG